jgi:hypothetical protein
MQEEFVYVFEHVVLNVLNTVNNKYGHGHRLCGINHNGVSHYWK